MRGCRFYLSLVIPLFALASVNAAEPIRVVKDANGHAIAIESTGWTKNELTNLANRQETALARVRERFTVCVLDEKGEPQLPPIGGNYEVTGEAVRFTPQFPLRPGLNYRAILLLPSQGNFDSPKVQYLKISIPAPPPAPPTRVTAIYPSSSTLPENQLRFYIHFSAPMAAGDAYSHVKLLQANGDEVKRAFLEIGEELWDGSGQRLTLLFDPGRVKQGLKPREEFGPVLESGQPYRLVIDKSWRDAAGQPLAAEFEKKFIAGPSVETAVDAKAWKITPPPADSRGALIVQFPRPLDRALLMRMLTVADSSGEPIDGEITLGDEERRWEFLPARPWVAGQFNLIANTALEDSAGNNLARAFEIDVFDRVDDKPGPDFVRIPFTVTKK